MFPFLLLKKRKDVVSSSLSLSRARARTLELSQINGCVQQRVHPEANRSLRALAFDWSIFLDAMEYTNQIQELTERSVSGCASGCTQRKQLRKRFVLIGLYF